MVDLNRLYEDDNVLNVFVYGSHLYGSYDESSDIDYIIVAREWFDSDDVNAQVYTVEQFRMALDRHDIQAMECVCAPAAFVMKNGYEWKVPDIDRQKLRMSISTIASNSWVKGKKKLLVSGDYDVKLAIKSVFHSLRILDYGIQIATSGKVYEWDSMNYVLEDLRKLSYQREDLWNAIDTKYRKVFNSKSSEFKSLAPKDSTTKDLKQQLLNVFNKYGIGKDWPLESGMLDEILNMFDK